MSRLRLTATLGVALSAVFMSGCITMFVDSAVKDVAASEYMKPPEPKPVQLLFSFQTKGTANAKATKFLDEEVRKVIHDSGLFSSTVSEPVAGGALISVTINNVPVTSQEEATKKGIATGLTFGLAGSTVIDGYDCTVDYIPGTGMQSMKVVKHHALYGNIGAHKAPPNAVKAKSIEDAIKTMTHQVLGNALKDLSNDARFLQ